jgi:2-(1,2-epoxy-1,2-dihydrophenyl)acetyl-CoA isomerase
MESLLTHDEAGVRTLTLNRPDALNAFNEQLKAELQDALKKAERDRSVRCLVITGAGRAFSAGQDLKETQDKSAAGKPLDFAAELRRNYNPIILKLRTLEIPIIASINGVAAGAGWSLALACDLRIASKAAKFAGAFSKIGLIPDSGMTFTLPRLAGLARALEIAMLGEPIAAEQALHWNLVNEVVEPDMLAARTRELAATLARGATRGLGLIKRAMNAGLINDLEHQLDYEADLQGIAGRTRDHHEGVAAFVEKRTPEFKGE